LTGSSIEDEDNLRFAVQQGVSVMIEEASLNSAPAAYDRMMSGAARFRMVLNVARSSADGRPNPSACTPSSSKGREAPARTRGTIE
jgi:hypothetical protein